MPHKDKEEYNAYMRKYMLERIRKRREYALSKLGDKCVNCGISENLEFDHIDPKSKKDVIANLWSYSKKILEEELAKCQLLCMPCHQRKSIMEAGKKIAKGAHGTVSSYRYCRCDVCREANSAHARQYRKKKAE
jgi:5-methylcytosine-specific restriction endonuclease McrA